MNKLIGFTGFKTSGKSECSNYLKNKYTFLEYSFAQPLKEGTKLLFGWNDEDVQDPIKKEIIDEYYGVSPRQILQHLGTDFFRVYLPNNFPLFKEKVGSGFWVKRFEQFFSKNKESSIVLADVRFLEEVNIIHSLGGIVVKVQRDISIPKVIGHPSEDINKLEGIDYVLDNNESIKELQDNLDVLLLDF